MPLPRIQVIGNVVDDPDLKFTQAGKPFAKFRVAANRPKKNEQTGEWEDGSSFFGNVTVWSRFENDTLPENVVETLAKGMNVIVDGAIETRMYTTEGGEDRLAVDINAFEVAVNLSRATAVVSKSQRQGGGQGQQQTQQAPQGAPAQQQALPPVDPSAPPF